MKNYGLWVEGYAATGEHGTAKYLGQAEGDTFGEAVQNWYRDTPDANRNYGSLRYNEKRDRWSLWGCEVFDNQADARRSFG